MRKRRIALVTGSSKGIERDIVLSFARSKDYSGIVTNSKKVEQAESVSKEIRNLRNSCDSIAIGGDFQVKMIVSS